MFDRVQIELHYHLSLIIVGHSIHGNFVIFAAAPVEIHFEIFNEYSLGFEVSDFSLTLRNCACLPTS